MHNSCVNAVATVESSSRCASGVALRGEIGFVTSVAQAGFNQAGSSAAVPLRCRWNVTVAVGQTVNVTLYDFGVETRRRTSSYEQQRPAR